MSLISKIKSNPAIKNVALFMLMPANEFRPRLWVRAFLNPFKHKRGRSSIIRGNTRMDVFPFNKFELGAQSTIESFATINNAVGDVKIGSRTMIGLGNVIIGPVEIGDDTMLAQNIVISGLNHGYEDVTLPPRVQKVKTLKITIAENVWIGANSVVTAGVSIGKHSVIGAGSVVTKSIPDYCVAVGNPARIVKRYNFENKEWEKISGS